MGVVCADQSVSGAEGGHSDTRRVAVRWGCDAVILALGRGLGSCGVELREEAVDLRSRRPASHRMDKVHGMCYNGFTVEVSTTASPRGHLRGCFLTVSGSDSNCLADTKPVLKSLRT